MNIFRELQTRGPGIVTLSAAVAFVLAICFGVL